LVNVSFAWPLEEFDLATQRAFCRFGQISVKAKLVTKSLMQCVAPPRAAQTVDFAISFDGSVWIGEPIGFVYKARFDLMEVIPGAFFCAVVVGGIVVSVWRVCKQRKSDGREFEYAPFVPGKANGKEGVSFARRKQTRRRNEA
jgi:hypothetical protein